MEDDVVVQQEVVARAGNGRVPLARQIRKFRVAFAVAGQEVLQLQGVRARIDNFLWVDASNWIARDVAGVIEGRLDGVEANSLQALEDVG